MSKSAIILVIFAGVFAGVALADDPECVFLDKIITNVQKHMTELKNCAKEVGTTNRLCVVKCTLGKVGLLKPDGTINVEGAMAMMKEVVPPAHQPKVVEAMAKCSDAASQITPNDATCNSYEPLVKCVLTGMREKFGDFVQKMMAGGGGGPNLPNCPAVGARIQGELAKLDLNSFKNGF